MLAIARGDAKALADYLMFGKPGATPPDDASRDYDRIIRQIAFMLDPDALGGVVTESIEDGKWSHARRRLDRPGRWRLEFKANRPPGNQPSGFREQFARANMALLVFKFLYPSTAGDEPDQNELGTSLQHGAMKAAYRSAIDTLARDGVQVSQDTVKRAYAAHAETLMKQARSGQWATWKRGAN